MPPSPVARTLTSQWCVAACCDAADRHSPPVTVACCRAGDGGRRVLAAAACEDCADEEVMMPVRIVAMIITMVKD